MNNIKYNLVLANYTELVKKKKKKPIPISDKQANWERKSLTLI